MTTPCSPCLVVMGLSLVAGCNRGELPGPNPPDPFVAVGAGAPGSTRPALAGAFGTEAAAPDAAVPDLAAAVDPGPAPLAVEEWGTFTSVQAADGHTLGGVHHEDEALPGFVLRRNWLDRNNYFFEALPEEPLQQLETPVLYFWSPRAQPVSVSIDFPEGVVGQWYPDATALRPALGLLMALEHGHMSWDVTVDPAAGAGGFAPVRPDEIWAPSRRVASAPVRFAFGGSEQFIFYRGLGKFVAPVEVTHDGQGAMLVTNRSLDELAAVFVLQVTDKGGAVQALGALPAGGQREVGVPLALGPLDGYTADARRSLKAALVATGLHDDVAQAMVDTWTRSWFGNQGLRVLYLAPRSWTDSWLPTTITPAPERFVRTLVGRIESLPPDEEGDLVARIRAAAPGNMPIDPATLGRFAEPRIRRALEGLLDAKERAYAEALLEAAHAMP